LSRRSNDAGDSRGNDENKSRRRIARERAVQVLFQVDMCKVTPQDAFQNTINSLGKVEKQSFAWQLVQGTTDNIEAIDQVISGLSKGWDMKRMSTVDRNILRLAVYEIHHLPNIPYNVTVDEAIELGKEFGNPDSGKFINGILGQLKDEKPEQKTEK